MSVPVYTPAEARTRETFLALMWALSYPGREYLLPDAGDAFALIAEALLDLETSYFSPDESLASTLAATGARGLAPERAAYHFYPQLREVQLTTVEQASTGTMEYPDQSATLIVGCTFGTGVALTLRGPGISTESILLVDGLPPTFWTLRQARTRFPLGWDVFLVDGRRVVGLPRSTQLTI